MFSKLLRGTTRMHFSQKKDYYKILGLKKNADA